MGFRGWEGELEGGLRRAAGGLAWRDLAGCFVWV